MAKEPKPVAAPAAQPAPAWVTKKSSPAAPVIPSGASSEVERLLAQNGCPGCNLSGADLVGLNLNRANLAGANLSGANLEGASLKTADLASANLSRANLKGANFAGADLYKADLTGAILTGTDFEGAYLIGTILEKPRQKGKKEDIDAFLAQYRDKTPVISKGVKSREKERAQQLENLRSPSFMAMQTTTGTTPEQENET
ncbi:MAG: pentapeptide repeat-containing protein, partial [Proteobacteria bacterium]|nr:pentapeptide repeat-containing protein [Pseudomonadota bacterium]